MNRIDSHQHFWEVERGDYGWLSPAMGPIYRDFAPGDMAPLLEHEGITRTVLVQAAPTEAETRYLLDLAATTEFVAGVVGWTDMAATAAPDRLAELAEDPWLTGIRPMIQDIPDPAWMLQDSLAPAFRAVASEGLVFDALVKPPQLASLVTLVERHPEMPVVIDHCGKPDIAHWTPGDGDFQAWAGHMRVLADSEAVACKLSGLVTEASDGWQVDDLKPYTDVVLEAFGSRRVLWGSDWPVLLLAGDYAGWYGASKALLSGLEETALIDVFGGNAMRLYGL